MRCYKRALKLDPDVEKKIADEEFVSRSSMDTTGEQATQLFMWNGFDLFSFL